jgi:hypothetical protein
MALVAPALAIAALAAIWHPHQGAGMARAATAATAVLFAALALTVPPARWFDLHCDALSVNLAILAAYATAGLWAAMSGSARRTVRFAILGASAVAGGRRLRCPRARLPRRSIRPSRRWLKPIWLDHVIEAKSILWLAGSHPATALAAVAFVFAGAVAQVALWRRRPDASTALAAAVAVLAAVLGCWQVEAPAPTPAGLPPCRSPSGLRGLMAPRRYRRR